MFIHISPVDSSNKICPIGFQAEGRLAAPWGWETPWSSDTAVITAFQGNLGLVKNEWVNPRLTLSLVFHQKSLSFPQSGAP